MRPLWGKNYVRITFEEDRRRAVLLPITVKQYTYYCPGARLYDTIIIPPNKHTPWEQHAQVVGIGRRWLGRIKKARLA